MQATATAGSHPVTRLITGRRTAWLVALLPILLAGFLISLGEAERPISAANSLPDGFGSTQAAVLQEELTRGDASAAILLWTADEGTLTQAQLGALGQFVDGGPFIVAEDGTAAYTVRPLEESEASPISAQVIDLRTQLDEESPEGVSAEVTGPAGIVADISKVFEGADVTLLLATASVVAVLLIITYRSPVLWLVPLTVVAIADRLAAIGSTQIMQHVSYVSWDQSTVGILSVLVFGAGTNYALLLISRYRDELKSEPSRHTAMARALGRTAESVTFSAVTVVLGVLTLLLSAFPSTRGLGLACAIGIVIAAFFALVVLPAALVLFGRWIFWPRAPRVGDEALVDGNGFWHKVGVKVDSHPRTFVVATLLFLATLMIGVTQIESGLEQSEVFLDTPPSLVAAERLGESFPAGTTDPAQVLTQDNPEAVLSAVQQVDGITSATVGATRDGIASISAVMAADPGSDDAEQTVRDLRTALVDFDDTYVGGGDAEDLDVTEATMDDRLLIFPTIALLVLGALLLLLRSVVAPIVLVATVLTTYVSAMGLSWWLFRYVFDFPAVDEGVPLFAFLFLVALGVDYNIFLITRAREEAVGHGYRSGMLRALTATGGVITSAGILLAAVFAVLGVLPLVLLAQLGIIIFVGVLLDTLLVRTVLVPALAISLGDKFWWPRKPAGRGNSGSTSPAGSPTVNP